MDAEGTKETADVVPDGLGAHVELGGDLLRRAALLQKTKHLDLTGSEMRRRRCGLSSGRPSNSPKTPTTRSPLMSGTELISTATRVPAVETKTAVASVAGAVPITFRENSSWARRLSSGATTEVKWRPRTSPSKPLGRRIDPADDSRCVEDVARDADARQSLLDVAADCQASGHHGSVTDPRVPDGARATNGATPRKEPPRNELDRVRLCPSPALDSERSFGPILALAERERACDERVAVAARAATATLDRDVDVEPVIRGHTGQGELRSARALRVRGQRAELGANAANVQPRMASARVWTMRRESELGGN